jgi:hypothetical protein
MGSLARISKQAVLITANFFFIISSPFSSKSMFIL